MNKYYIKKQKNLFSKKNKIIIFFLFFLIMIIISGFFYKKYQYYNDIKKSVVAYEKILELLNNNPYSSINHLYEFSKYNKITSYSNLIELEISKILIMKNNFLESALQINSSLRNIKDLILQSILRLRLARIQIFQKNFDEAIKILNFIQNNSWISLKNIFIGEAFLKKNNFKKAYKIWKEAFIYGSSQMFLKEITEMKINNLQ